MHWHAADAVVVGIALPISLAVFSRAVYRKTRLLQALAPVPDPVADHPRRIQEFLTIFLGQKKLFQDPVPGLMHALIFWGFCALLLRALTLFGMALGGGFGFHLPFLGPDALLGRAYGVVKDGANIAVTLMILLALFRRYIQRVKRLRNTGEALFVLLMILTLMLSDMLFSAALSGKAPAAAGHAALWVHCLGILVFLAYLPTGKHMHILTSAFNVYLRPLHRGGRLTKLDLADEKVDVFGTPHVDQLTGKDGLDLYSCTECGRCNEACPANGVGKKLAPREIITAQKDCLKREAGRLINGKGGEPEELAPASVTPEEFWACTTCQACEQACPVSISHVQRINSLRRSEVLMQARFPAEVRRAFKGLENNSNPWGLGAAKRAEWAKGLDLPLWRQAPAEYLLYFGCAASLDDRAVKVSRSLVSLLKKAGVSFAVLGEEELCCGETARRLGEEALGQSLVEQNTALLNELKVKKILTPCPHCFNTFKNEYPDFGGSFEVLHHTRLLQGLVLQGKLKPKSGPDTRVVIHDSCYLGRANGVYDPARELLAAVGGAQAVEPSRCRETGFCCGAGGGLFWVEEKGPRVNHERVRQLHQTKASVIATSCPYCLSMLETGVKDQSLENLAVKDLAEILEAAL
ncbi:MAG: (Fe-S)-binding protein [Elusimicrobia bacterium]|nr:(Fe-S)-binding protein [Elusimicrobiota bacterium]